MHDLETIIVFALLALNFIPQRSHHSLTLPSSRFRDAWGWHNSHPEWETAPRCKGGNNNWPTTLSYGTPDITLTSLLRQPSTITCCNLFYGNFDRQHRNSNTHNAELIQNSPMVDFIKGCAEICWHYSSLLPTIQCIFQCIEHAQKCITDTQTTPISNLCMWLEASHCVPKSSDTRRPNILDKKMLWKSVGNRQQSRTVDLSVLMWHWPVSIKHGNYTDEHAAETLH